MARNKIQFRFYRSNLESVIWDAENDCPLAKFVNGEFITTDAGIAKKLEALGYPRVGINDAEPPDILYKKGDTITEDIKILPNALGETAALNREKRNAEIERQKKEVKSPADYKKKIKRRSKADLILEAKKTKKPVKKSESK